MDDLTTFLRARLDETEELARQAAEVSSPTWWDGSADVFLREGLATRRRLAARRVEGALDDAVWGHVVRHDPARALADVEAKQRIVAIHGGIEPDPCDAHDASFETIACDTLRLLALPYADHHDYREEWRP